MNLKLRHLQLDNGTTSSKGKAGHVFTLVQPDAYRIVLGEMAESMQNGGCNTFRRCSVGVFGRNPPVFLLGQHGNRSLVVLHE